MKKIGILILSFFIIWGLCGCDAITSTNKTTTSMKPTTINKLAIANEELERIKALIPEEINGDLTLPLAISSDFIVTYSSDELECTNGILKYLSYLEDYTVKIEIKVEYKGVETTSFKTIKALKDEAGYFAAKVQKVVSEIKEAFIAILPSEVTGNFRIEKLSFEGVTYSLTVSDLVKDGDLYLYNFPLVDQNIKVTVKATYEKTVLEDIVFDLTVKSVSKLKNIPKIYIETENRKQVTSKEDYIKGSFTLAVQNDDLELETTMSNLPLSIKGRGNSTWGMPKKPYRIKFDSKQSLFGQPKAKSWVLLANYMDHTLIRNYLAYTTAAKLDGLDFTPCAFFVDLYLNGEYLGNYMVTDQIEVSTNRVAIEEDSSDVNTGYLIELDQRLYEVPEGEKGWDWFELNDEGSNYAYMIKYPEPDKEFFSLAQHNFIKTYMGGVLTAVKTKNNYQELIDINSFIDYFIMCELFKNVDSGYSSVYYNKTRDGLLKAGPVWDFDLSSTNPGHLDSYNRSPEGWYTSLKEKNRIYYYLMKDKSFKTELRKRWYEINNTIIKDMMNEIDLIVDEIKLSRVDNFNRWDILGKNLDWYTSPEVYNANTYEKQIELLRTWLDNRIAWLNQEMRTL